MNVFRDEGVPMSTLYVLTTASTTEALKPLRRVARRLAPGIYVHPSDTRSDDELRAFVLRMRTE